MSYLLEKSRRKKASRKKMKVLPAKRIVPEAPPPARQSLLGKLSFFLGLIGVFFVTLQYMLKVQAITLPGTWVIEARWMRWLSMGQLQTGIFGLLLALLAFVFSTRRKATAIFGFLFSLAVLVAWVWLENYNIRRL